MAFSCWCAAGREAGSSLLGAKRQQEQLEWKKVKFKEIKQSPATIQHLKSNLNIPRRETPQASWESKHMKVCEHYWIPKPFLMPFKPITTSTVQHNCWERHMQDKEEWIDPEGQNKQSPRLNNRGLLTLLAVPFLTVSGISHLWEFGAWNWLLFLAASLWHHSLSLWICWVKVKIWGCPRQARGQWYVNLPLGK